MQRPPAFQLLLAMLLLGVLAQGFFVVHRTGQVADRLARQTTQVRAGLIRSSCVGADGVLREVTTERYPGESQEAWIARHWSDWEALMNAR